MVLFDFCEECITIPKSALRGQGTDNPILLNHRRKNSRNDAKKEIPQFHGYAATTVCVIRNRLALKRASEECSLNSTVLLSKRDRMAATNAQSGEKQKCQHKSLSYRTQARCHHHAQLPESHRPSHPVLDTHPAQKQINGRGD